jgi:hypothetical protein
MKKLFFISLIFSLIINNLLAIEVINPPFSEDHIFSNLRESSSRLISSSKAREIEKLYNGTKEIEILEKIISDRSINRCATKIIAKIKKDLSLNKKKDIELAILGLRSNDSIDDISADILIKANDLSVLISNPIARDSLNAEDEEEALKIYKNKAKDIHNGNLCFEDTYKNLVNNLSDSRPKFIKRLKHINKIALNNDLISDEEFKKIELLRINKVHEWPLTLSTYAQSLEAISKNFQTRKKESSSTITNVKFRQKKSIRQKLYEKFDSTQIMLLANIVRDLKVRLESKEITIAIDYENQKTEIITLSPMEKFRCVLKLLRKELSTINNSSLLGGNTATYMDLIAASYEVGYISSLEIEQLASLQEIWNPSKTKKEKLFFWLKTFGDIASIVLPPPFDLVPVLAIMVIDYETSKAPVNRDPDYNIF